MAFTMVSSDFGVPEGVAVTNTKLMANGDTIFTIANGPIKILELLSICQTTNDATASTVQYSATPTLGGDATTFSAATGGIGSMEAGSTIRLNMTALNTAPDIATDTANPPILGGVQTQGIIVGAGVIKLVIGGGSTTGTWQHHLRYAPMAPNVTVTGS